MPRPIDFIVVACLSFAALQGPSANATELKDLSPEELGALAVTGTRKCSARITPEIYHLISVFVKNYNAETGQRMQELFRQMISESGLSKACMLLYTDHVIAEPSSR